MCFCHSPLLIASSSCSLPSCFFFFSDTATTEIYTLSLHDALPISRAPVPSSFSSASRIRAISAPLFASERRPDARARSEEHTSELQSHSDLVCRLLLEKKKKHQQIIR